MGQFFASVTPRGGIRTHYTLDQWKALGYDQHSTYADPQFVDFKNGKYRLQPGSPALQLDFVEINIGRVGLLPDFPARWLNENSISHARRSES